MEKASAGIVKIMLSVLVLIAISIACKLPSFGQNNLILNPRAEDGSVSGSYAHGNSGDMVSFIVTKEGFATFQLDGGSDSETLTVDLSDEQTASMVWNGTTIDGFGGLNQAQQSAFNDLVSSSISDGLKMIPLDIACLGEDEIDPKQVAALLVPLQMRFKYLITDRDAESQKLLDLSQCGYGENREDEPGSLILVSRAAPVPVVFGYFPFDAEGAVEAQTTSEDGLKTACLAASPSLSASELGSSSLQDSNPDNMAALRTNETGPCGALCRGACGADCEPNNCKESEDLRCEVNEEGLNTGMVIRYQIYDCGLHQGCIDHDNCYDRCNQAYGCDTWLAASCMHDWSPIGEFADKNTTWYCDQQAVSEHGAINPPLWTQGLGPQPIRETFEYLDEDYEKRWNPEKCPTEDKKDSSPPSNQSEKIPAGIYNGTVKVEGWFLANERFPITEVIINNVRIQVLDDGTVSGTLNLIYDTEFTASSGNIVEINQVYLGTFSGRLTGMSGTIDLELEKQQSATGGDGYFSGEAILDFIADIQVAGENISGSVGPHPSDYYFFFEAVRE